MLADGDLVHLLLAALGRDHDLALAALDGAERDAAIDLGDGGRVLGPPGLEQLGDPRQTAGDVTRLVDLAADLGQRVTRLDLVSIANHELRADRNDELTNLLAILTDVDLRVQLLLTILDDG